MVCVVQHSADGSWHRAQVVKHRNEETVEVRLVDYGYQESRPIHSVKIMEDKFLYLPPQAYNCKPFGLKQEVFWTVKEKKLFETAFSGLKLFSRSFVGVGDDGLLMVVYLKYFLLITIFNSSSIIQIRFVEDGVLDGATFDISELLMHYPPSCRIQWPRNSFSSLPLKFDTRLSVTVPLFYDWNDFFLAPPINEKYQVMVFKLLKMFVH